MPLVMTALRSLRGLYRAKSSFVGAGVALVATAAAAATGSPPEPPAIGPIPADFVLFGIMLAGVALFHRHTLGIAVAGLAVIAIFKLFFSPFPTGPGVGGLVSHLGHEWVLLANLLGLLVGFALLSRAFRGEQNSRGASQVPAQRLERCIRSPADDLRAVELPR